VLVDMFSDIFYLLYFESPDQPPCRSDRPRDGLKKGRFFGYENEYDTQHSAGIRVDSLSVKTGVLCQGTLEVN